MFRHILHSSRKISIDSHLKIRLQLVLGFAIFQALILYLSQINGRSLPICNQLQKGASFDPSISIQFTPTSAIGIFKDSAMYNISTSNAHLSMCKALKMIRADSLVKSLKPHWVSLTFLTQKNQTKKWKPCIRIRRNKVRFTSVSCKCALDPHITAYEIET